MKIKDNTSAAYIMVFDNDGLGEPFAVYANDTLQQVVDKYAAANKLRVEAFLSDMKNIWNGMSRSDVYKEDMVPKIRLPRLLGDAFYAWVFLKRGGQYALPEDSGSKMYKPTKKDWKLLESVAPKLVVRGYLV